MRKVLDFKIETTEECSYILGGDQVVSIESIMRGVHAIAEELKVQKGLHLEDTYVVKFPTDEYPVGIIFNLPKCSFIKKELVEKELLEAISALMIILADLVNA